MDDILGLALKPIVPYSGAASRPLASSANGSMQKSSGGRIQKPIVLDFHSERGNEEIRAWYRTQPTTQFTGIEYRKDIDGNFRHEFIIAYLDNSTVCRFDRRAQEDMRGYALKNEGTISEDSAHVITLADKNSRAELDKSEVLLSINLPEKQDLRFILAVCCGIQSHPKAKSYSLVCFNCYFFSWTLVMNVVRKSCKWEEFAQPEALWRVISGQLLNYLSQVDLSSRSRLRSLGLRVTERFGLSKFIQRSLSLAAEEYIMANINQALKNHIFNVEQNPVAKMLLRSQLSSAVTEDVHSIILGDGYIGAVQFAANVAHVTRPPTAKRADTQHKDVASSGNPPPRDLVPSSWNSPEARAWRKAQERIWMMFCRDISSDLRRKILAMVMSHLPEPEFTEPEPRSSGMYIKRDRFAACYRIGETVEGLIKDRMLEHFEQIEAYGLGNFEVWAQAETSMCEIWVSVLDMMKDESQLPFL